MDAGAANGQRLDIRITQCNAVVFDQRESDLMIERVDATLDIQMPRKTGILFFRQMRSQPSFRNLPVVVITGLTAGDRDMETFIHSFLDVEHLPMPNAYLEKPVEADRLLLVVGNAIGKRGED